MAATIQAELRLLTGTGMVPPGGNIPGGGQKTELERSLGEIARFFKRPQSIFGGGGGSAGMLGLGGAGAAGSTAGPIIAGILGFVAANFSGNIWENSEAAEKMKQNWIEVLKSMPDWFREGLSTVMNVTTELPLINQLFGDWWAGVNAELKKVISVDPSSSYVNANDSRTAGEVLADGDPIGLAAGSSSPTTTGAAAGGNVAKIMREYQSLLSDTVSDTEQLAEFERLRTEAMREDNLLIDEMNRKKAEGVELTEGDRMLKKQAVDLAFELDMKIVNITRSIEGQTSAQAAYNQELSRTVELQERLNRAENRGGRRKSYKSRQGEDLGEFSVDGREGTFGGRIEDLGASFGGNMAVGIRVT